LLLVLGAVVSLTMTRRPIETLAPVVAGTA
jgi:hypothetical protein